MKRLIRQDLNAMQAVKLEELAQRKTGRSKYKTRLIKSKSNVQKFLNSIESLKTPKTQLNHIVKLLVVLFLLKQTRLPTG